MITTRTTRQCGRADYGWLQARYTLSFRHYLDPKLLGYASLYALNQRVLAPGASFQPRAYLEVDIIDLILEGETEYRDSEDNHIKVKTGEVLLLVTQPGISYGEHNINKDKPLTRMQLWLNACPQRENACVQKATLGTGKYRLLTSSDGEQGSLRLCQQVRVYYIELQQGESLSSQLHGPRVYLQSIHGRFHVVMSGAEEGAFTCGNGAFIRDETNMTLVVDAPLCVLLIDLSVWSGRTIEYDY